MHTSTMPTLEKNTIVYPDSDGKPMADNTRQLLWIIVLYGNLAAMFQDVADVFVSASLLWYVVEGDPKACTALDVLVAFGRPKGHCGSYRKWEENDVPVTVAFEIMSPKNTIFETADKLEFNDRHGVEEYYVYDPETNHLLVYLRQGEVLRRVHPLKDFVSPRLGIRFDLSGEEMVVYRPDGQRFLTPEEQDAARRQAEQRLTRAIELGRQAQAEQAEQRFARVIELGRKARLQQATPEELAELERLEEQRPLPPAAANGQAKA